MNYKIVNTSTLIKRFYIRWMNRLNIFEKEEVKERGLLKSNIKKNINTLLDVILDLDKVVISETLDTKENVISIHDSNGKVCSLWLDLNGKVRSISSY